MEDNLSANDLRIVLLVMSCNDQVISSCVDAITSTLGLTTQRHNIKYLTYTGGHQVQFVFNDNVWCTAKDNLDNSFLKTQEALSLVKKAYDPDYVIRVNSSTYANLELLCNLLQSEHKHNSEKLIYNGDVSDLNGRIQLRGNSFILGREIIDRIIEFDISEVPSDIENLHDDVVISYIVQKEIGLDKTVKEIVRSEKIGVVPMIYLNDLSRLGHPMSVIDEMLVPERMRKDFHLYKKEKIDELIKRSVFIAYRKNYVKDRYQEIGECYKIRDVLKDFTTDEIPELVKELDVWMYREKRFEKIRM